MSIIYTRKACLPLLLVSLFSSFPAVCRAQAYEALYEALPPVYNAGKAPPTPVSHPQYVPTEAPAPLTPSPQPVTYESTTALSTTQSTTTPESTTSTTTIKASTTTEINRKPIYKVSFKPNRNIIRTRAPTRLQKPKPEVPKYTPKFKPKNTKTRLPSVVGTRPKYVRPNPKVTTSTSAPSTTTLPPTTTTLPPTTTTLPPATTTLPPKTTTLPPTKAPTTTVTSVPEYQKPIKLLDTFYPPINPEYPLTDPAYPQASPYPEYPPYPSSGHGYSEGEYSRKPYSFSYGVKDGYAELDFGHEEASDGKAVAGSYKVRLPDGRLQTVTYNVENGSGFLAQVQLNGKIKQR